MIQGNTAFAVAELRCNNLLYKDYDPGVTSAAAEPENVSLLMKYYWGSDGDAPSHMQHDDNPIHISGPLLFCGL